MDKSKPQTMASRVIEAQAVAVLEAFKDKRAIPALAEISKASFFLHQMAQGEAKKKQFARTVSGTKTDFYDRKIIEDAPPSIRSLKRAMRKEEVVGWFPVDIQESLMEAGLNTLDQILIKGSDRVDYELLSEVHGIGKCRIEKIKEIIAERFASLSK